MMIWVRALDRNEIFKMGEEAVRGFSRFALPRWCFAPLFAREPQMRTHLSVYPVAPMIACAMNSFGNRRKLTASMDSVNTSLTFGWPRSLT